MHTMRIEDLYKVLAGETIVRIIDVSGGHREVMYTGEFDNSDMYNFEEMYILELNTTLATCTFEGELTVRPILEISI